MPRPAKLWNILEGRLHCLGSLRAATAADPDRARFGIVMTPIADGDNAAYLGIDASTTGSTQGSQWVKAA